MQESHTNMKAEAFLWNTVFQVCSCLKEIVLWLILIGYKKERKKQTINYRGISRGEIVLCPILTVKDRKKEWKKQSSKPASKQKPQNPKNSWKVSIGDIVLCPILIVSDRKRKKEKKKEESKNSKPEQI